MTTLLLTILAGVVALVLIGAALAPLEALGWWAGWFEHDRSVEAAVAQIQAGAAVAPAAADHYAVFLTGVGGITGEGILPEDQRFLDYLRLHAPQSEIIANIFPYSVVNVGLTGQRRPFARMWRWVDERVSRNRNTRASWLIRVRNLLQVGVSADHRYGPIYNLGVAKEIVLGLVQHGYRLRSGVPVTLIGSSGGAQVSLGAAAYLGLVLGAPLQIVSIGGAMSGDRGILRVDRLDHLYGTADPVPTVVGNLFPDRWPFVTWSVWNRALARGVFAARAIGPLQHSGEAGYFGAGSQFPDGQSNAEHTAVEVAAAIGHFRSTAAMSPARA